MSAGTPAISILIIDDNVDVRRLVTQLVRYEPNLKMVGEADSGQAGLEQATRLQPQVVLVDSDLQGGAGLQVARDIAARVPAAAVVVMGDDNTADAVRRAMATGAKDYLVKPFGFDELQRAVLAANQQVEPLRQYLRAGVQNAAPAPREDEPRARTLAFFSLKGGQGRSSLASNLALVIKGATDARVVLVDANVAAGDLGVLLNVQSAKSIHDLAGVATLDDEALDEALVAHPSGIKILLPAPTVSAAESVGADLLRAVIEDLRRRCDYLILDTRAIFDDATIACLDAADVVVVPLLAEMAAVKCAKQYLEVAELLGYPAEKSALVLNRAGAPGTFGHEEIEAHLKTSLRARIPEEAAVTRSVNEGIPLATTAPELHYVRAIVGLASGLTNGAVPSDEVEVRRGIGGFTGLFRRGQRQTGRVADAAPQPS